MLSDGQYMIFGTESSLDMTMNTMPGLSLVEVTLGLPECPMYSLAPPVEEETAMGKRSPLSPLQMRMARPTCLRLLVQLILWAFFLAAASAGKSMAARMAMMAITTSSSM